MYSNWYCPSVEASEDSFSSSSLKTLKQILRVETEDEAILSQRLLSENLQSESINADTIIVLEICINVFH